MSGLVLNVAQYTLDSGGDEARMGYRNGRGNYLFSILFWKYLSFQELAF